jgi:DNA-binding response OmpR family regulator
MHLGVDLPVTLVMDVLIVERDELIAAALAEALADDCITASIAPDENEAMTACHADTPRVVLTGINRQPEDMKGLFFGRALRVRCPWLAVVYLGALWPVRLHRCALDVGERFLTKPVATAKLVRTVRALLPA